MTDEEDMNDLIRGRSNRERHHFEDYYPSPKANANSHQYGSKRSFIDFIFFYLLLFYSWKIANSKFRHMHTAAEVHRRTGTDDYEIGKLQNKLSRGLYNNNIPSIIHEWGLWRIVCPQSSG